MDICSAAPVLPSTVDETCNMAMSDIVCVSMVLAFSSEISVTPSLSRGKRICVKPLKWRLSLTPCVRDTRYHFDDSKAMKISPTKRYLEAFGHVEVEHGSL